MPILLHVLEAAADRRPITPAELEAATGIPAASIATPAKSAELADDVAGRMLRLRSGVPLWRQLYYEQLRDRQGDYLRPARWPIEGRPPVYLGDSAVTEGLFQVGGECRHYLYQDPIGGTRRLLSQSNGNGSLLRSGDSFFLHRGKADFALHSYRAGFVQPGQVNDAWAAATAYDINKSTAYGDTTGSWLAPNLSSPLMFEVGTAGTSGGAEPDWPLGLAPWSSSFVYTLLNWLQPKTSALLFQCTTPGTSGTTVPAWPTVAGQTVTDGTAIWTARVAMEITDGSVVWTGRLAFQLPTEFRRAALLLARKIAKKDQDGKKCKEEMVFIMSLLRGACF